MLEAWHLLGHHPAEAKACPCLPPVPMSVCVGCSEWDSYQPQHQPTAARARPLSPPIGQQANPQHPPALLPDRPHQDARCDKQGQGPVARIVAGGSATSANSGATAGSGGGGVGKPKTPIGGFQAKRVASGALEGLMSSKPVLVTVCCGGQTGVYDVRKGSVTIRFGLQGKVRLPGSWWRLSHS